MLVADDHPVVRGGMVALIDAADGMTVVGVADDGPSAVDRALDVRPDVVVIDLRMPGFGGEEATARILARAPEVRVVVLTTYENDDAILAAIEAGASGYLLKAAPEEEILAGIRAVARGEVALAPRIAALLAQRVAQPTAAAPTLSPRETDVLRLVAEGLTNRAIGERLHVSEPTVKTHLVHAFGKLGVDDRTRAVTRAMELGLL